MDLSKALEYLKSSFLRPLLLDEDITDISYNGKDIYYQNNILGRQKYEIEVSKTTVFDFLRQIANLCQESFSISKPILDVSIKNYRLNATYLSIARNDYEECVTFSLRISRDLLYINDKNFMPNDVKNFLINLVKNKQSIIIGGQTSTGKTELQKYLIRHFKANTKAIIIDNVLELNTLTNLDNIDVTCWQFDSYKDNDLTLLIKNSLRNNPDYLIIAESRGEEMFDILTAAMGGTPIITTIHGDNIHNLIHRIISLTLLSKKKLTPEYVKSDVINTLHYYVFLKSHTNKNNIITRHVEQIGYIDSSEKMTIIYDRINKINNLDKYKIISEV